MLISSFLDYQICMPNLIYPTGFDLDPKFIPILNNKSEISFQNISDRAYKPLFSRFASQFITWYLDNSLQ